MKDLLCRVPLAKLHPPGFLVAMFSPVFKFAKLFSPITSFDLCLCLPWSEECYSQGDFQASTLLRSFP